MFHRLLTFTAAAILSVATVTHANAQGRVSVAEPDGFAIWGTSWRGTPGSLVIAWYPVQASGNQVAICGMWVLENIQMREGARQLLRGSVVNVDGQSTRLNMGQLARASSIDGMQTTDPTCIGTGLSGPVEGVSIAFGDGSFRD
ncbi:MAG: hypothetical protein AAF366_15720 [Pseudomonadota bacterium]